MQFLYSLQDVRTPLGRRDELAHPLPRAQELTYLFKGAAEPLCRGNIPQPQHRVVAVLDPPLILLDGIGPAGYCHLWTHSVCQAISSRWQEQACRHLFGLW